MSKTSIQPKPATPPEKPAPPKSPAPQAPPFTVAKPRQPNVAALPPARAPRPGQQVERQREAPAGEARTDPNAATRFDAGMAAFFAPFGDEPEGFGKRGGGAASLATHSGAVDQELDCAALAKVLPAGANDGIFDVALPTGERLGVVVSGQGGSLSYLLSPSSDKLGARLRRQRMELEDRMERLTHRNVNITVL